MSLEVEFPGMQRDETGYFIVKVPAALKDYPIRLARWLRGDTIASVVWTVATGLTNVRQTNTTTEAVVWLGDGAVGTDYPVSALVTTAAGRVEVFAFTVRVRAQYP
jgi:hypothetical protein